MNELRYLPVMGFSLAAICLTILHFVKPEISVLHQYLTEYANGKFGILLILAFVFFGFGLLGLAHHSYRLYAGDHLRVASSFLFVMSGFACLIVGMFPVTLSGTPFNMSAVIHTQTAPVFMITFTLALSLFTFRMPYLADLRTLFKPCVILAVLCWITLLLQFLLAARYDIQGLTQRVFTLLAWSWSFLVALNLAGQVNREDRVLQVPHNSAPDLSDMV